MGRVSKGVSAIAVVAALAAAPASLGDPPKPGKRYDGRSGTGQRTSVEVNRAGTELADYGFSARMRCSDGRGRVVGLFRRGEGPTRIQSDGGFSYRTPSEPFKFRSGLSGRAQTSFSGRFVAGGDTVTGTMIHTFRSRRVRCSSGSVPYTLHRDGTPGAAYRNPSLATGLYRGRGRRLRVSARAFLPARGVESTRLAYKQRCRSRVPLSVSVTLVPLDLRGSRISRRTRSRFRVNGLQGRERFRFSGRFSYSHGYRLRGRLKARAALYRRGRKVDSCRINTRFTARFVSGPIGAEGPHPGH